MKRALFLFSLFFLGFVSNAFALDFDLSKAREVAATKYWQRLLHYKFHWLGGWKSAVDGEGFFFSPQGKKDPYAELLATVDAFSKNLKIGKQKQHPQCAFPERFHFLRQELQLKVPAVNCPKLEAYIERFHAASATLVFSSAYQGNPGSMFGHTFLRINSKPLKGAEKKLDLLDQGISYAADTGGNESGILFALNGLFGGYQGRFSFMPYYIKVNEYNNAESRDLWEYELNLTEEETLRLLRNVWELETNSYFDYYFSDENCSYQLLALLEVAKPEWNLTSYFIHFIPGESVKKLTNTPGAVRGVKLRPSLRKKLLAKYDALSGEQKKIFHRAQENELSLVADSAVLDTLIASAYYEKQKDAASFGDKGSKRLAQLLLARSKIESPEWKGNPISESSRPDLSHYPYRVGWSHGEQIANSHKEQVYFSDLNFKIAYHDLLNDDTGYSPFSEINFSNLIFRYIPQEKSIFLQELQIASLISLNPWLPLEKGISWRFSLSDAEAKDLSCDHCHLWNFNSGAGLAFYPFTKSAVFYSMLLLQVEAGRGLARSIRYGPKLNIGLVMNPWEKNKILLELNRFYDLWQRDRQPHFTLWQAKYAYALNQHWDFRSEFSYWQRYWRSAFNAREYKLGIDYYF